MSKNVIHNFSIIIKNIEAVKSSEDLKEIFLKELTKVSKGTSKEKDIVQLWQEYQNNCVSTLSNISPRIESNNTLEDIENPIIFGTTNSILKKTKQDSNILSIVPKSDFFTTNSAIIDSLGAANVNSLVLNDEEGLVNSNNMLSTQIYSGVSTQQSLLIPSRISITDTYSDVIKTKFKKSLGSSLPVNHLDSKNHKTLIAKDFNIKMNQEYFSEQMNIETQGEREELYNVSETFINNVSWKKLSELMIFKLSELSKEEKDIYLKEYYDILIKKIKKPSIDIQQLFSENDELFLLLKSVFPGLPERITIHTPRIIYPDLCTQKMYPDIGVGNMYFKASGVLLDKPIYNYNGEEFGEEKTHNRLSYDYAVNNSLDYVEIFQNLGGTRILSSTTTGNLEMTSIYIGRGYKNYNKDIGKNRDRTIFPGIKIKEHTHLLPTSSINSSGSSIVLSENYSGPKYINSVTTSINLTSTSVTGIYYNSIGNKVSNISKASSFIVTKNTETLTVKVYPSGDVLKIVNVQNSNSITTYDITGNSGMDMFEGKQLANPKTIINTENSTMKLSDTPKVLKEVADLKGIWNSSSLPNPAGDHIDSTIERTIQQENNYNENEINNEHKPYR
jgi:hypothetical protein